MRKAILKDSMKKVNSKISVISVIALILFINSLCPINTAHGAFTPTLSSPAQTETTVTLSWTKSNDLTFKAYQVAMSWSANGPYYGLGGDITDPNQTAYAVINLNPNTPYYFRIEDFSGSDTVIPPPTISNTLRVYTAPNPSLSAVSTSENNVSLRWVDYNSYTSVMPFIDYVLEINASGGEWSTVAHVTNVTQNTYNLTGLTSATYQFRMVDEVSTPTYLTDTSYYIRSFSNVVTLVIRPLTPTPSPISTSTPSIPELSWLVIVPLLLSLFCVAVIVRHRKNR